MAGFATVRGGIGRGCPQCGRDLMLKNGQHGQFVGCSGWSYCDYTESLPGAVPMREDDDYHWPNAIAADWD